MKRTNTKLPQDYNCEPSDIVSGWAYRKLVNDYKVYDSIQKTIIKNQREEIKKLNEVIKKFNGIPETDDERINKIANQKEVINRLTDEIETVKKTIGLDSYEKSRKIQKQEDTIKKLMSERDRMRHEITTLNSMVNEFRTQRQVD